MDIKVLLIAICICAGVGCIQENKKEIKVVAEPERFIKPPIKGADVPFKEYIVDAAKGDTVYYPTGSIILFPPNSFVDKDGNVITGNVQIKYREFSKPIDFFLSGIPMEYDSAGVQYSFQSAGMCEILAYKDGAPVFVNPVSKPEINLANDDSSPIQNLYYLDTAQRKWVNKGASIITNLHGHRKESAATVSLSDEALEAPIRPEKADNKSPVIEIVIDPASFKELMVYNNLKFQLDADEKDFNPNDTSEEWKQVELQKGSRQGLYTVKFSNAKKTVSYTVRPVLEGADYDKALKVFDKNIKEYNRQVKERLAAEKKNKQYKRDPLANEEIAEDKKNKEQYLKDLLANEKIVEENKRIEKLNLLIEARNREIEKERANAEKISREIIEKERANAERVNREMTEKANAIAERIRKQMAEAMKDDSLIRSFQIDGFGIWNCDRPSILNCISINPSFTDLKGTSIELIYVSVICKSFKEIIGMANDKIRLVKNGDNMIAGVFDGRFAYLSYEEYKKLNITETTKEETFIMSVVSEENNNYEYIKGVAEGEK